MSLTLRNLDLIIHKLKYMMRTFTFNRDVTEEYLVANAIRGAYYFQITSSEKDILDEIVSCVFNTKFNDYISYTIL